MEVILGDLDFGLRTFLQFSAHVPIVCGLSKKFNSSMIEFLGTKVCHWVLHSVKHRIPIGSQSQSFLQEF